MPEFESHADDERAVELSSISAIYPEILIDPSSHFKASLDLPVAPASPLQAHFLADSGFPTVLTPPTSSSEADLDSATTQYFKPPAVDVDKDTHQLSHLPPLNLEIELPEGYPSEKAPIFKVGTNPPWLPRSVLSGLIHDGNRLWEEGGKDLVVYTYIDHLQQQAETAFGMIDAADGEAHFSRDLKIALLDFNNKAETEKFEQETFECGVCLEPKKGVNCHRLLGCAHVFCIPCLQDFYNACITEGDVDSVRCLTPNCSKENAATENQGPKKKKRVQTLNPSELLQIPLEQQTVQRYVFLKRKKRLEADKTTIYCPRKWCQGAARSKKHPKPTDLTTDDFDVSDEEDDGPVFDPLGEEGQLPPMADRVAICEDCGYAFCSVCKKGWHGELVRCFPRREAELSAEEKATEAYLKKYTSPCPTCNAPCQKRMGCNHMICFSCGTHFCYLCSSWLDEGNPYRHFNTLNYDCYNRLWDMEGGDGVDPVGSDALHQIPIDLLAVDDHEDAGAPRGQPAPPPAPVPPGRLGHPQRGRDADLDAAGRAAAAEQRAQARAMAEVRGRPDQGAQHQQPARRGLQRFLDLVNNDREDEWDSDELDDDF